MATIVCQGLQSRLESHQLQVLEPRTISLKLSCFVAEKRFHSDDDDEKQISSATAAADDSSSSHCWSFLQAISNNGSKLEATNKETTSTYVHPMDNRSKSTLSEKSLELCTENLGSETGTDIIIEDDGSSSSCGIFSENGGKNIPPRREVELQKCAAAKKVIARNFPPPLTTIRGVASLQVRPHREDGRLIIKATKAPSPRCSLFQAERSHGRLRLSLYKDTISDEQIENDAVAASCGDREDEDEDEDEEEEEEEGDVAVVEGDFDVENDGDMGEEEEEGVNGNHKEFGGKMGIKKKFPRRGTGRCKEGEPDKKGLLNWEALWVATS